ncbi:UPF0149 family protein [Dokdonella soli]|uniref:UPF0149 family protein n=1 Tax=Dokdonella soli TaxID=529810 RepID=A0ABN1IKB7_9GAMM
MHPDLTHAELAKALDRLRLGVNASDLHGSLTGYLCAGAQTDADGWLDALQLDFDDPGLARNEILQRLYRSCLAQFGATPASVDPLLPASSAPLACRADALVEWCRGFLGGFGLAGAAARAGLTADATEILADLGTIAASRFDYADTAGDEQALADVLDFVRTGAALLHRDVRRAARAAPHSLH